MLIHEDQVLDVPFELSCHVEACDNQVGADLQELCVGRHVALRCLNIYECVRVHLDHPLDQLHVVQVELPLELLIGSRQFFDQERGNVPRVTLRSLFQRALLHQESSRVHCQIVIEDNNGAHLL